MDLTSNLIVSTCCWAFAGAFGIASSVFAFEYHNLFIAYPLMASAAILIMMSSLITFTMLLRLLNIRDLDARPKRK